MSDPQGSFLALPSFYRPRHAKISADTERRSLSVSARVLAFVLALYISVSTALIFSTQDRAYAAPLVIPAAAAVGLPLSVVSAGVSGGVATISTGGALASAAITGAAAFAANWAVDALFSWGNDTPEGFADPAATPITPGAMSDAVWPQYYSYDWAATADSDGSAMDKDDTCGVGRMAPYPNGGFADYRGINICIGAGNAPGTFMVTWSGIALGGTDFNYSNVAYLQTGCGQRPAEMPRTSGGSMSGSVMLTDPNWPAFDGCGVGAYQIIIGSRAGGFTSRSIPRAGTTNWATSGGAVEPGSTPITVRPQRKCSDGSTVLGTPLSTKRDNVNGSLRYPACPAGTHPTETSAPITRDSDGAVVGQVHNPWSPPAIPAIYPECQNYTCVMTLTRTWPDGQTITCNYAGVCTSYADVVKQWPQVGEGTFTGPRTAPDGTSYQCKFGPYAVAVAECQTIPGAGLAAPATGTGTGTQPNSGECKLGMSWNPIDWVLEPVKCALKWAFYPSPTAVDGWKVRAESIKGRPPVNIMAGGVDYIGKVTTIWRNTSEQPCAFPFTSAYGHTFDVICSAGNTMQTNSNGRAIYKLGQIAIIGTFVWWAWRRISASFGGREST